MFFFAQWTIIRGPRKDVLKQALEFVDVGVVLASKIKLDLLSSAFLILLLLLEPNLEVLPQLIDDAIVVEPMLLIELIEQLALSLLDLKQVLSDFEPLLDHLLGNLLRILLFVDCEVAFGLVESRVDGVDGEGPQQCLHDEFEVNTDLFVRGEGEDHAEINERGTSIGLCMGSKTIACLSQRVGWQYQLSPFLLGDQAMPFRAFS